MIPRTIMYTICRSVMTVAFVLPVLALAVYETYLIFFEKKFITLCFRCGYHVMPLAGNKDTLIMHSLVFVALYITAGIIFWMMAGFSFRSSPSRP